jgi:hypothetical protein
MKQKASEKHEPDLVRNPERRPRFCIDRVSEGARAFVSPEPRASENSPALKRWEKSKNMIPVPEGRLSSPSHILEVDNQVDNQIARMH